MNGRRREPTLTYRERSSAGIPVREGGEDVKKAERAWDSANANAERKAAQNIVIGGRALSTEQVRELNTAKRALARVLDPASSPAEAAKAWNLVQTTVTALRLRPSESLDAKLVLALPSALRELTA